MPDNGLSGQYGSIPYNVLKQKYEVTATDDPQVNDYWRKNLKDTSCDATFFESDHTRRDNHSDEFLSLRFSGHRSGEVPDAPDLCLELTERDPRGTGLDPNFRHWIDQSWARAGDYNFYDDSDNSVTEREKPPQLLIEQIRDQFENIKQRLKIFSTSKDSMASGSNFRDATTSKKDMVDQNGADAREELSRTNLTSQLSNSYPLGWEQTGDHEFNVAQYGQVRSAQLDAMNAGINRRDTNASNQLTTFQDQVVTAGVAQLMKTIVDARVQERDGTKLRSFAAAIPKEYRFFTDPKPAGSEVATTQAVTDSIKSVENFIGQLNRQTGSTSRQDIESQLKIVSFMDAAIRPGTTETAKMEWQNQIASAKQQEAFGATATKQAAKKNTAQRETQETARRFESMQVARLGSARLAGTNTVLMEEGERYKKTSAFSIHKTAKAPNIRDPYTANRSQRARDMEGTSDRFAKPMGDKMGVRAGIDSDGRSNAISRET
jgi:hypothetical protein